MNQPLDEHRYMSRLLSCYINLQDHENTEDVVMLCEVTGNELQSVSLRVAADPMQRMVTGKIR